MGQLYSFLFFSCCTSEFFCAAGENFNFHSIPLPAILFSWNPVWLCFGQFGWDFEILCEHILGDTSELQYLRVRFQLSFQIITLCTVMFICYIISKKCFYSIAPYLLFSFLISSFLLFSFSHFLIFSFSHFQLHKPFFQFLSFSISLYFSYLFPIIIIN